MSETPYRSGVSIDALAEEVKKLKRELADLHREFVAHFHVIATRHCPGCGKKGSFMGTSWLGSSCSECDHDLTSIHRAIGKGT